MDCGCVDAQKVLRGETSAVSAAMSRAMAQAESEAGHSGDLRMAELLLDRACYEEMSALASETGSTFLKDYVALQIDAVNLRTLVRARRMGCEDDVLAAAMLPGGHIPAGQLKGARGDHLSSLTHGTPLDSAGELAAKLLDSGGGLTEFERACDDALMSYLQRARRTPFGPEVVAGYLGAKEAEFTAVRTILSGKIAGIAAEDIRARLRMSYL